MKLPKLLLLFAVALLGSARAATVTVSSGTPTQGITLTLDGVALNSFTLAVGNFNEGVFTLFTNSLDAAAGGYKVDTAKIGGITFDGDGPSTLNSAVMHLFVGNGTTKENSTAWMILGKPTAVLFPSAVDGVSGTTFSASTQTAVTVVASSNASFVGATNVINFVAVPEPSVALLGALGVLGLVRRRR